MKKNLLIESKKIKSLINRMDKKLSFDEYVIYESKQLLTEAKIPFLRQILKDFGELKVGKSIDELIQLKITDDIVEELENIGKFLDGNDVPLKGNIDEIVESLLENNILKVGQETQFKKYLEITNGLSKVSKGTGKMTDILEDLVKGVDTNFSDEMDILIEYFLENTEVALKAFPEGTPLGITIRKIIDTGGNVKMWRDKFISQIFNDAWRNFDNMSDAFKASVIKKIKEFKSSKEIEGIAKLDKLPENIAGTDILFKEVDGVTRYFAIKNPHPDVIAYLKKNGWGIKEWNDFSRGAGMKGTKFKQFQIWLTDGGWKKVLAWSYGISVPVTVVGRAIECYLLSDQFHPIKQYSERTKSEDILQDWTWKKCFKNVWIGEQDLVPNDWKPKWFTWQGAFLPVIGTVGTLAYNFFKNVNVLSFKKMIEYQKTEVDNDLIRTKKEFYKTLGLIQIIRKKCTVTAEDVQKMKDEVINYIKSELGDDAPEDEFSIGLDKILGMGVESYDAELDKIINKYQNKVADLDELNDDVQKAYETNNKYKVNVNVDEFPELDFNPDIKGNLKQCCIIGQTEAAIEVFNSHDEELKNQDAEDFKSVYENAEWNLEWYTENGKLDNERNPGNVSVEACEYNKDKFINMLQILGNIQDRSRQGDIDKIEKTIVCSKDNMKTLLTDLENSFIKIEEYEKLDKDPDYQKLIEIIEKEVNDKPYKISARGYFCWETKISPYMPLESYIDIVLTLSVKEKNPYLKNILLNLPEGTDWKKSGTNNIMFKLNKDVIDSVGEKLCNCESNKTKGVKYLDEGVEKDAYEYCMKEFKDAIKDAGIWGKFSDGTR